MIETDSVSEEIMGVLEVGPAIAILRLVLYGLDKKSSCASKPWTRFLSLVVAVPYIHFPSHFLYIDEE